MSGGIYISDTDAIPDPPQPRHLRLAGWRVLHQKHVVLAQVAGVDLKSAHGDFWAPRWFVKLVEYATRHEPSSVVWVRRLARDGILYAIGMLLSVNEVAVEDVDFAIPRALRKSVVFGPIRMHPDGCAEILHGKVYKAAPAELCRALDAEQRLTGCGSKVHEAALILLDAYEREEERKNG